MHDEVGPVRRLVDVFVDDAQAAEGERKEAVEDVVVVTPQVDDLCILFFNTFKDQTDKACMGARPTAPSTEGPSVDDVAVEDDFVALGVLEDVVDFVDLAVRRTEVKRRRE